MIVSDDWAIKHEYAFQPPVYTARPALRRQEAPPFRVGRVLVCGPAGCCRSDPWSVTEADADRADQLVLAQRLVAVTEAEVLDAAVYVPRAEVRGRAGERHGRNGGDTEEAELFVAVEGFVVVAEAQPDLDRHGDADSRGGEARPEPHLQIGPFFRSAVCLAAQLARDEEVRLDR